MEVRQVHQVSAEKQHYLHSKSLSKPIVFYARDEDPDDTMLLRNLFSAIKEYRKV